MVLLLKSEYIGRMRIYFAEMFPIPVRLVFSALCYMSFVAFLQRISGIGVSLLSPYTLVGIASVFAFTLILRLMDELKDREVDRELFSERPLPSGRVLEADIKASLVVVICCYLAVNSWTGKAFLMSIVLLAYSFLMFKFFFMPHILSRYLLLNLATHNPVVPLMLLYLVTLFSTEHGISIRSMNWFLVTALVMMFWSIFFSWEIARKIRSSQEENDYVTYSRILGPLGAVLVAGGAQTFAFGIGTYFYFSFSLSWLFLVLLSIAYSRVLWAYFRFILHPDPVTSKLKPIAEQYAGIIFLAGLIDYIISN